MNEPTKQAYTRLVDAVHFMKLEDRFTKEDINLISAFALNLNKVGYIHATKLSAHEAADTNISHVGDRLGNALSLIGFGLVKDPDNQYEAMKAIHAKTGVGA